MIKSFIIKYKWAILLSLLGIGLAEYVYQRLPELIHWVIVLGTGLVGWLAANKNSKDGINKLK